MIRADGTGSGSGRHALRLRAAVCVLAALANALRAPQAAALPHDPVAQDACVRQAEARLGLALLPAGEVAVRVPGKHPIDARRLLYVDVRASGARLPLRLRLYCRIDAEGQVKPLATSPRTLARVP